MYVGHVFLKFNQVLLISLKNKSWTYACTRFALGHNKSIIPHLVMKAVWNSESHTITCREVYASCIVVGKNSEIGLKYKDINKQLSLWLIE